MSPPLPLAAPFNGLLDRELEALAEEPQIEVAIEPQDYRFFRWNRIDVVRQFSPQGGASQREEPAEFNMSVPTC